MMIDEHIDYNGDNMTAAGYVPEGKRKSHICDMMCALPFRTFSNIYRRTIDRNFTLASNREYARGMRWSELASYIIGDGSFSCTMEQYHSFMDEAVRLLTEKGSK